MTPSLLDRGRRLPAAGLVLVALLETAALAAAAALGGAAVSAVMQGDAAVPALLPALAAAAAAALGAAGLAVARAAFAEWFGMSIATEVRERLADHAIARARDGRAASIGVMSARMAGDLVAIKDWMSVGISDAIAAAAALMAGLMVLVFVGGPAAGAAGAALLAVNLVFLFGAGKLLERAWLAVRRGRGRVADVVGHVTLGARAIARFRAGAHVLRRLRRRSQDLQAASVRQRALATAALLPSAITLPAVVALAVVFGSAGLLAPQGLAAWTSVLFGAGLLAGGLAGLGRASDALAAFRVADARLGVLQAQATAGAAATADTDPVLALAAPGEVRHVEIDRDGLTLGRLQSLADTLPDGRTVSLVAPDLPLLNASVRRNLAPSGSQAARARIADALMLAGLDPAAWPEGRRIDPLDPAADPMALARLRLARAIAARPGVIVVADPMLLFDGDLDRHLANLADTHAVAVICARPPPPGTGI